MFSMRWKAVLGVLFIFILGCACGGLVTSIVYHRMVMRMLQGNSNALTELLERRMTRNLGLDATQQAQIHTDFEENAKQRKLLQKQIQPQIQMLNRATYEQILAILHPDQAEHFRQNIAQFRQRFGKGAFTGIPDNKLQPVSPSVGATTNVDVVAPPAQ